ncbi:MobF family relaxase [Nocardiopsis sp. L17-MgMaSL7]|uniref:MobF family relaxase n=1 Tax=Nocardiopsis sp. L17-MgMaSL7 TaxID=1938893 RepID=UPI000D714A59|nr:MobF family relaxase [Nocardiopsis sp. L17-MgMaSL7]
MATPIHDPSQGDYRLAQQCGADDITAENVAVSYRLNGGARPIERVGSGWSVFDQQAGSVLANSEDVEAVRRLLAGRHPTERTQLVKPKVAVAPAAKLTANLFGAALQAAAAERETTIEALLEADPWSLKRAGRLARGIRREGDRHRVPVADLERMAKVAGIDLATVYEDQELTCAQDHREDRVRVGVMGFDVTFDRPKGISVLQAMAPPEMAARMEKIHLEAVRESMAALESWTAYAMAGHHGDGQRAERVATRGFTGTMTVHRTARPVDGSPGDPHLHTHVLVANMALGRDGKWRTIAAGGRDLMRHIPAVGQLYRALERHKLTAEFGVRFEADPKTQRWDVAGVPAELKATFSRRQQQVLKAAGHDASVAQQRSAARATARAKHASTPTTERASWHERAVEAGFDPAHVVADVLGEDGPGTRAGGGNDPGGPDPDRVAAAVWDPQVGVTAHEKVVTTAKVMAHVAGAYGGGLADSAALEELTRHVLADPRAVPLPESGPVHMSHSQRFTSADIVDAEALIVATTASRTGARAAVVERTRAERALASWVRQKGFTLSGQQARAVGRLIKTGHGVETVLGVAGAGKTTLLSAARTAWEAAGYRVEGAAVAAVAAAGLRAEAGITSRTVAAWTQKLTENPRALEGVDVLVVDEAAMIGDRDLAVLTQAASRARTKLVLVGDPKQLRPVAAGGSFATVHRIVAGVELTENRRQRSEADRRTLDHWRLGARRSALAAWGERGMLHATLDADAAHNQMAACWWADRQRHEDPHEAVERLLMLAATNADVNELNQRARAAARGGGLLQGQDVAFTLDSGQRLELAAGDQVRVRRNDYRSRTSSDPDVLNGYRGIVLEVDERRGALVQWRREERAEQARLDPEQLRRGDLSLGYAITIAAAQGVTADRAHVYGLGADAHSLYAGMSRARERTDLYLPSANLEREEITRQLGQARTEKERCERVVAAYAASLTQDPPGMVLDELGHPDLPGTGHEVDPEHEPVREDDLHASREPEQAHEPDLDVEVEVERVSVEAARQGQGPACREVAEEVTALRERAAEREVELTELRERYQQAEQRAGRGHLALMLEGTTRSAAGRERDQALQALDEAIDDRDQARGRARELQDRAVERDVGRAQMDQVSDQVEELRERVQHIAEQRAITRAELAQMEREDLEHMQRRHAIELSDLTRDPERRDRVQEIPEREPRTQSADQEQREYQERIQREAAQRAAAERDAPSLGL